MGPKVASPAGSHTEGPQPRCLRASLSTFLPDGDSEPERLVHPRAGPRSWRWVGPVTRHTEVVPRVGLKQQGRRPSRSSPSGRGQTAVQGPALPPLPFHQSKL